MGTPIAFVTANYIARETEYGMKTWAHGAQRINEAFSPIDTYATRLDTLVGDIRALGFDTIDLWTGHLNPVWATEEHVSAAIEVLSRHGIKVSTYAVWIDPTNVVRACEIALGLGTTLIGAGFSGEPEELAPVLAEHGVRLGIENHPEKSPDELLAKIERGAGTLAATVDTGWWGTHGYDAARAIEELGEHVVHVHLKDVLSVGEPHVTCRWGDGVVAIEDCLRALARIDYGGAVAIEHEPANFDPSEDVLAMRMQLAAWLS